MDENLKERMEDYAKTQKFKTGDILFVGSTYETRQYYGFYLVLDKSIEAYDHFWEDGVLHNSKLLRKKGVKYQNMFHTISTQTFELLFEGSDVQIEDLQAHGLY